MNSLTKQSIGIVYDDLTPHFHGVVSFFKKDLIAGDSGYTEADWNLLIQGFKNRGCDILSITEDRVFIGIDMGSGFDYLSSTYENMIEILIEEGNLKE